MSLRPPTLSTAMMQTGNPDWVSDYDQQYDSVSPSSAYIVDSPSHVQSSPSTTALPQRHPLSRPPSEEESFMAESNSTQSPARSPQLGSLPDPSQYPDPYPFRPRGRFQGASTPALSSADSSSTSTRSSAYTNSAKSGDYGHVHVALGVDEPEVGVGITTDDVVQLLAQDPTNSTSAMHTRVPVDASRWSGHYANSVRSRSSSGGKPRLDSTSEPTGPTLTEKKSFDMSWQTVDERDEINLTSEDETDDDDRVDDDDDGDDDLPTSAMIIAEEGLGVIVRGEDTPIVQLQIKPGTTHLLIGSSSTPNAVPSFLTNNVPAITTTLLALDISANFLVALPPALASCICLEELNVAANPLRALPLFLSSLISLKVLIADSTGISTLPTQFSALDKLHSLSIRRNKMHSLPSWLCLLPSMETLLVDGNPFQGPWKALVEPLLAKVPMSPLYPPSTPIFPPPSASIQSAGTENETDPEEDTPSDMDRPSAQVTEDEDTIMPSRAPHLTRAVTAPLPPPNSGSTSPLQRTRTTPNRGFHERTRAISKAGTDGNPVPSTSKSAGGSTPTSVEREVRRMKSAGELRRNHAISVAASLQGSSSATSSPQRPPAMSHYITSASSSNLLTATAPPDSQKPMRFASLGVSSGMMSPGGRSRPAVDHSIWDNISGDEGEGSGANVPAVLRKRSPTMPSRATSTRSPPKSRESRYTEQSPPAPRLAKEEKDKSNRWGFLKKMSMGKMRTDAPSSRPSTSQGRPIPQRLNRMHSEGSEGYQSTGLPKIDVRISTTGALLHNNDHIPPSIGKRPSTDHLKVSVPPPIPEKDSPDALKPPTPLSATSATSGGLLGVPTATPRAAKRRSFLPIDVSPIPVPAAAPFLSNVTATNGDGDEGQEASRLSVNTMAHESMEHMHRREEEKAREARQRALRSVMAYLRDMHDLGLSQTNVLSMYGGPAPGVPGDGLRSRRPTIIETNGRLNSEFSLSSSTSSMSSRPDSNLRNSEARYGIRSGTSTQTNSVATTDSTGSGSGEERKYKDDKAKRARVIREIVETERTYVKGLQELVDIYINPACASVNVLSGVSQHKETLIPAAERKIVFNGLEALFSFHHGSFLPALETAAAPLLRPPEEISQADHDGQMSLTVSRTVAQTFVSHAAFMRMYSTYINNFDNSVQRIKSWVSDRVTGPATAQTLSPSSSTAQLVGFGMTMSAVSAPGVAPDNNAGVAALTSSQRKRIKTFLKRCRMSPRHSQLNLEGYLLLPVQRIPRYKLLLEELLRSCPPMYEYMEDPLDRALSEISVLATNMNEGKRESESRRRLVGWQARIRGKFPSPLVQPHRRLIMDGRLHLTRVVRKATVAFEVIDSKGDGSTIQVECLSPELTPRSLVGVLCNDLLVLCRDPSDGQDPGSPVDLWAVLRMQTLPQPASIVHGNALRLVDNKAILYFEAPSTSDAVTWYRAINMNMAQKA
ncbi:hypothetical protein EIP91_008849 [Steccherinum ochraceum]|uniref:DH domain-containing protein n=1 Tax=Steccherinum ochraceum TaxID=92696 RepID=A0A4R0RYS8_9APHY|nr:hypothetical protein EIP91_008849 [Steccherinum ochraceum]